MGNGYEENNENSFSERNNNMHAGNAGNGRTSHQLSYTEYD